MLNILSLLSFANAVFLLFLSGYSIVSNRKSPINQASSLECFLLAVWSFSYTFFYVAPNKDEAWFWLRFGSIGWSAFMGALVWFFLEMTRQSEKTGKPFKALMIWAMPVVLILLNFISPVSSAAVDLKLSSSSLGWTYVNSVTNPLYWLYVCYLLVGVYQCVKILKKSLGGTKASHFRRLAIAFLVVDSLLILCGFFLDLIIPQVTDAVPPLTNVFLIIFSFSYWIIISKFEVFQKTSLEASEYVLQTISDALMVLDKAGNILKCNKAACDLLKYESKDIVGRNLISFFNKDSYDMELVRQLSSEKKLVNLNADLLASDGSLIHAVYSASVVEDETYGFMGTIISFHDITKQKKLETELYELAHYDPLTGLPNRRMFLEVLHSLEETYRNGGNDFGILFMDLNGFKKINDIMGHDKGDLLLVEIGKRIKSCTEEGDIIARLGGDEFVMLQINILGEEQVEDRKAKITNLFEQKFIIKGQEYPIGVSLGYALYSETMGVSAMLREADQRMYSHKTESRNARD